MVRLRARIFRVSVMAAVCAIGLGFLLGAAVPSQPEYPPAEKVLEGFEKVVSTADGARSYYTIYTREKDGQMYAALPGGYEGRKFFMAMTIASGEDYAGLQAGDMYVYWRRYDNRLALIEPNVQIRSTGDAESRSSIQRLYTDRVLLDVPIVTMLGGSPVIDMDALLVGNASTFFAGQVRVANPRLVKITKAKAFPENVELAFEVPTSTGRLQSLHYSISQIPSGSGYRPRKADERVGYFTTTYQDFGKLTQADSRVRYINRWHLEKADPSLQLSPPKQPIVFYIEHTTPVRYRRWIREGILHWNKAFEKVGISNAIEVYYQDERNGAHMEKDPEDVRYNFIRWLSNNQGTAIGPSRVHPETGQILDADVILTDGWIRHYWTTFTKVMPKIAMEGMNPDTLAWLRDRPNWDPRVLMCEPSQRAYVLKELEAHAHEPYGGHALTKSDSVMMGKNEYDGLADRTCQVNGMCTLTEGKAFDVAMFRMMYAMMAAEDDDGEKGEAASGDPNKAEDPNKPKEPKLKKKAEPMIDDMPESFIGPLLSDLVCHEVGHTLGLRHNFKASSVYRLSEINSKEFKGNKPMAGSIMDYLPVNINFEDGEIQGDYGMIGVGPYDMWAIQYGYTPNEAELPAILSRVAEPELQYATDEDTYGPDPLARRYDFGSEPLDYAKNQVRIAQHNRGRIINELVKDGESWARTRQAYEMTLAMQLRAVSMMSNWLGGAHVYRDKKGDKDGRLPIEVVSAEKQRNALNFVIENTLNDEAFGLTNDLLVRMSVDKWWDDRSSVLEDATWPIHDRVMSIQASALASLMYPSKLSRIYDNEFLVSSDQDALTLPELLTTISKAVWSELDAQYEKTFTTREPMISSLRRNLQRVHMELLVDLAESGSSSSAANKPISDLALQQLRQIRTKADRMSRNQADKMDEYTAAHLKDVSTRIRKALGAHYVLRSL